jgi:DNA-binding CsgD family transcriptional regulator
VILLLLGISFYLLWLIAGTFSSLVWYGKGVSEGSTAWSITLVANTLMLLAAYFLMRRVSPLIQKVPLVMASACVTAAGIALVSLASNLSDYQQLLTLGCILTGIGAGPLALCWRECSENIISKRVQRTLFSLALVLDALFYLLLVSLPFIVSLVICTLSPILAALFFIYSYEPSCQGSSVARVVPPFSCDEATSKRIRTKSLIILFVCCFFLSIAQGIIRTGFLPVDIQLTWTLIVSSAALTIIVVVACELFFMQRFPEQALSRLFFPLVVIIFLSLPFFTYQNAVITHFFIFAGCFLLIIYIYSEIDAANPGRQLPTQVFAFGIVVSNVGCILGIVLEHLMDADFPRVVIGVFYGVLCLMLCLYRELTNSPAESERFLPVSERAGSGSAFQVFAQSPSNMIDSISHQCHSAAKYYALSAREEEVLSYLVRGKSAKSIADTTYISYNTVKTHISHIYQKFDVHTREELIQIVESVPADQ